MEDNVMENEYISMIVSMYFWSVFHLIFTLFIKHKEFYICIILKSGKYDLTRHIYMWLHNCISKTVINENNVTLVAQDIFVFKSTGKHCAELNIFVQQNCE